MPFIQWNSDLEVKVREIDKQHQQLVSMINDLYDAMQEQKGRDAVGNIVNRLIDYTKTHFSLEEKYFDRFN